MNALNSLQKDRVVSLSYFDDIDHCPKNFDFVHFDKIWQ